MHYYVDGGPVDVVYWNPLNLLLILASHYNCEVYFKLWLCSSNHLLLPAFLILTYIFLSLQILTLIGKFLGGARAMDFPSC